MKIVSLIVKKVRQKTKGTHTNPEKLLHNTKIDLEYSQTPRPRKQWVIHAYLMSTLFLVS